ncbi:restriction endonuclease subunit S [Enterococcus faecalis]|nr:restriction endonuclease subunit S [Enterococcus faecalis]
MMSKKSPQLRFEGFTDDWEERKFKDILKTHSFRSYLAGVSEDGEYEVIQQGDKPIVGYSDGEPFTDYKDITLFGDHTVSLYKPKSPFFVATDGVKILSADNFEGDYLYTTLERYKPEPQGYKRHFTILKNQDVWFTENMEEQQKIGVFFKQLDDTITLHQRKLDLLKEQKKAFLQKMFPKKGEKVPELRFAGFADDWEERKLGELSQDTFGGGTPKTSVTEYWNGEIPWIQSSDLSSDHLFGVLPKKHITENAVKNSATKLIPKNSIAIVTRVGVGKLAFMPYEFTSSQDFLSLSNLQVDCNFGMYSIYKMLQRELNNIQGTSIKGITKADLLDKEVIIPVEFEEQQRIGSFFKQLDDTIALHQRKLDLLKEQKKGFLQKMFV